MSSLPFTIYDFFAYLSTGALWILGADYAFSLGWILGKQLGPGETAGWVVIVYVIGHINSHWASWLLESQAIRRLGYPSQNLFAPIAKRPFRHYRTPLPRETAAAILAKVARLGGPPASGEAMFLFCYHLVKERCPQAYARLQTFLNLYGFARNTSFATLLVSGVFVTAAIIRGRPLLLVLAAASLLAAGSLFFRYLKFFRHYSIEVFTSFLTGVTEPGQPKAS